MRHAAKMLFRRRRAAGVFDKNEVKTQLPGVARRRFDADIRGDTAQDNRIDTATAKLQLQVGAVKGPPLAFGDFDIARLFFQRERIGPPVFR